MRRGLAAEKIGEKKEVGQICVKTGEGGKRRRAGKMKEICKRNKIGNVKNFGVQNLMGLRREVGGWQLARRVGI